MTIAHKMTYHSLYRLEKRGLLSCSVVGVAVEDWSHDELVENVRSSILAAGEKIDEPVLKRLASRLSYVECWRVMQPLLDAPPSVLAYEPGTWGPSAADALTADVGGWHAPWMGA